MLRHYDKRPAPEHTTSASPWWRHVFLLLLSLITVTGFICPEDKKGRIEGRVTDEQGSAAAGVQITTSPVTSSATTNATGDYAIGSVPAGTYTVAAGKSGYQPASVSVVVTSGGIAQADLQLIAIPGEITGRITNSGTSAGVAGATVTTSPATSSVSSI